MLGCFSRGALFRGAFAGACEARFGCILLRFVYLTGVSNVKADPVIHCLQCCTVASRLGRFRG